MDQKMEKNKNKTGLVLEGGGMRGIYTAASPAEILAYREPQTAAFLLNGGAEHMLSVPRATLHAFGCEGEGRTVWI